jgi:malto-oligosyltrehalose trehalohydrolase
MFMQRPSLEVVPLTGALGAEIFGVDLTRSLDTHTFGALHRALLDYGGVGFRLWAPAAAQVELCLYDGSVERRLAMTHMGQGWHYLDVPIAGPGSRYRFRIDGGIAVPDPASRFNPDDVHGASEVIEPLSFNWQDSNWFGRDWAEAVIYELHVGAFTPEGTFRAAIERLDYLAELGVTAIELMPVADFPGRWNWGYDGALAYAPDASYGRPDDLKALIQATHERGLMVLLDVVYNHFGPEGNYLHLYAPAFFTERHHTPWGAAINYDGDDSRTVRDFFIHNALYWLEEYRCDGLRLDAVHAIADDSRPDILEELAEAVRSGPPRKPTSRRDLVVVSLLAERRPPRHDDQRLALAQRAQDRPDARVRDDDRSLPEAPLVFLW